MTSTTLVLDASWRPYGVVGWQHAVVLVLDAKARLVAEYADRVVRSPQLVVPWPAVVALHRWTRPRRSRFNRQNVLARDGYACVYCGYHPLKNGRPNLEELTLDHVVPRARSVDHHVVLPWSGKRVPITCWENIVTCCVACNSAKADRTPAEARMRLRQYPTAPSSFDAVRIDLARMRIPDEWRAFVPDGWRDYWTVELDPS